MSINRLAPIAQRVGDYPRRRRNEPLCISNNPPGCILLGRFTLGPGFPSQAYGNDDVEEPEDDRRSDDDGYGDDEFKEAQ